MSRLVKIDLYPTQNGGWSYVLKYNRKIVECKTGYLGKAAARFQAERAARELVEQDDQVESYEYEVP